MALCDNEVFEVIFMDIQMPEISGIEASQHIRKQSKKNQGTPIIAVTAHAQTEDRNSFMRSGMNDFLGKPIMEDQLRNLLEKWSQAGTPNSELETPQRSHSTPSNDLSTNELDIFKKNQTPEPHTEIRLDDLPPVDLSICLEIAGSRSHIAIDMLTNLLSTIKTEQNSYLHLANSKNAEEYHSAIHKLHGLACYTGVPKLKKLCRQIEDCIKKGELELAFDLAQEINSEIGRLLSWQEDHEINVLFE